MGSLSVSYDYKLPLVLPPELVAPVQKFQRISYVSSKNKDLLLLGKQEGESINIKEKKLQNSRAAQDKIDIKQQTHSSYWRSNFLHLRVKKDARTRNPDF